MKMCPIMEANGFKSAIHFEFKWFTKKDLLSMLWILQEHKVVTSLSKLFYL